MKDTVVILGALTPDEIDVLRSELDGQLDVIAGGTDAGTLESARYLVVRDQSVDARILQAASQLQGIVRLDAGSATVDDGECQRRGITVDVVPSATLISVAEHTILLMLALVKRFVTAMDDLRTGVVVGGVEPTITTQTSYAFNWIGLSGFDALYGKRIGLVGMGKIGREVAIRLRSFGADVVYTKHTPLSSEDESRLGVRFLGLNDLLQVSDCVSLHHRFDETSERYMGRREFGLMKWGAYFVNTARGRLVDEEALVDALESAHLAGAALDVFWYEPLPPDSPLLGVKNLILSPHVGGIPSHTSSLAELAETARLIRSHHVT